MEQYRQGITFFSILAVIAILFPPIKWAYNDGRIIDRGVAFIFAIPKHHKVTRLSGEVDIIFLLLELLIIGILAVLFQLYYEKIFDFFRNNT